MSKHVESYVRILARFMMAAGLLVGLVYTGCFMGGEQDSPPQDIRMDASPDTANLPAVPLEAPAVVPVEMKITAGLEALVSYEKRVVVIRHPAGTQIWEKMEFVQDMGGLPEGGDTLKIFLCGEPPEFCAVSGFWGFP